LVVEVIPVNVWREARATVFTGLGLLLAFSVTQGWGWPLLSGPRAGILALGLFGVFACASSGMGSEAGFSWQNPLVLTATTAGIVLVVAGVIGLFANSMDYLYVTMLMAFVLWLVATARHIFAAGPRHGPVPAA